MAVDSEGGIVVAGQAGSSDLPGLADTPAGCRPSPIQHLSFAARLTPDGTSASLSQLFYGSPTYLYGASQTTGPIAVASSAVGAVVGLEQTGLIAAANLFLPARLACVNDPADNVQLARVAPGQDLTLFGSDLAPANLESEAGSMAKGVNVRFSGIPAGILYASATQVNLEVPADITGQNSTMELTNAGTTPPLDETRTFAVVAQQPSVFLTADAVAGAIPSCVGTDGISPAAVALNADGSRNAVDTPAVPGSMVTLFLNGVNASRWTSIAVTGMANDKPTTFTPRASNSGVLPVSFQVPESMDNGVTLTQLKADGVAVRETVVSVCVTPEAGRKRSGTRSEISGGETRPVRSDR